MSSIVLDIKSAITRNPIVITRQTTVEDAIAYMQNPHAPCLVPQKNLKTYRVDFVTRELHDELRSRYLVVMEHQRVIGLLTFRDLLFYHYQSQGAPNLTVDDCVNKPFAVLNESALTELETPLNLLRQHQMRPIVVLDHNRQLTGLLAYEELHAVALARQVQPFAPVVAAAKTQLKTVLTSHTTPSIERERVMNKIIAQVGFLWGISMLSYSASSPLSPKST